MTEISPTYTAFDGHRRLAGGSLLEVALAARDAGSPRPILIYDDSTGKAIDLDLRGSDAELAARYAPPQAPGAEEPRGRGRPKLGVVAREITLLPRHWDWLGKQPGGASVALRKLVDEKRLAQSATGDVRQRRRAAQDAAYHFMSAMAGDLADFEEAIRALYADDGAKFTTLTDAWPTDIRDHARKLAKG